jgi:hypothetical protein
MSEKTESKITCDRCGKEWDGIHDNGGNCTCCGDDLCAECAGEWNEDGECRKCQNDRKYKRMTLQELEFRLPMKIQIKEKMKNPCPNCTREEYHTVTYEQCMVRFDNYYEDNKRHRAYHISYHKIGNYSEVLCETDRHNSLRDVLIDAHHMLDDLKLDKKYSE